MKQETPVIQNVSDTALWVAYYRSLETDSPNPLFKDPLAKLLIGERGQKIAESIKETSAHTQYNVLIRTVIIDRYIQELIRGGVDCIINLGAGMDTRPYRLDLPVELKWIEIDYPHIIALKDENLKNENPKCKLKRVALDLNDRDKRKLFLDEIATTTRKIAVITEGVLPYLTPDQVNELAEDLLFQKNVKYWIADYISPTVYKYLSRGKRAEKMKNAPFQFYPPDWLGFFRERGWEPKTIQYLPEEGAKLGRQVPAPWFMRFITPFLNEETKKQFMQSSGYMIMERQT